LEWKRCLFFAVSVTAWPLQQVSGSSKADPAVVYDFKPGKFGATSFNEGVYKKRRLKNTRGQTSAAFSGSEEFEPKK